MSHDKNSCWKCARIRAFQAVKKATAGEWASMTEFIKAHVTEIKAGRMLDKIDKLKERRQ